MFDKPQLSTVGELGEFLYIASPQQGDLRLSGHPSGEGAGSGARTRDRRVPADLRADSQATVLPTPPSTVENNKKSSAHLIVLAIEYVTLDSVGSFRPSLITKAICSLQQILMFYNCPTAIRADTSPTPDNHNCPIATIANRYTYNCTIAPTALLLQMHACYNYN
ncbi:hypothetical protein PoB_006263700 [Plakobranchus ocellatus]|uniref:Uncharacterized protein n=1 Tax=Plakobranchus ocellatus TaxID=259542 RepID=A0AAV4CW41_9GAST|nr:hypothetical protein PoB_006263700 [Plakobranchus ocellatus]